GTPTMFNPRSVNNVRLPIDVTPVAKRWPLVNFRRMVVPGAPGLRVFLIRMGIALLTAGAIVAGWSTFAPKYDIYIACSYVICGSTNAEETALGSALSTPSTSVQISIAEALIAAPMIAAV